MASSFLCRGCRKRPTRSTYGHYCGACWSAGVRQEARAQGALWRAVQSGELTRPESCGRCGALGRPGKGHAIEGHHADYAKPLEVEWLCRACHRMEHGRLRRAMESA